MRAFSKSPAGRAPPTTEMGGDDEADTTSSDATTAGGRDQDRVLAASIARKDEPVTEAPCGPGNSGDGSALSSTCGASRGPTRAGHSRAERWMEPKEAPVCTTGSFAPGTLMRPNHCHPNVQGLHGSLAEGLPVPHETQQRQQQSVVPQGSGEEANEGCMMDDNDVDEDDWLQAALALSALSESVADTL